MSIESPASARARQRSRSKGTGTIEQRSPGSYRIRYDAGEGPDGKRIQKSVTVRGTKKEAEAELRRLLTDAAGGTVVNAGKLTVGTFLQRWLKDYASVNVAPKTYERYAEIINAHLEPALGRVLLTKLQPIQIQAYYTTAVESGRRDGKGGLSKQTVLHHHRVLREALRQGVRWQLLVRNPVDAVEPPRPDRTEQNIVDQAGVTRLLTEAQGTRLHVPVLLAATTGLRLGEVLGLRWDDIDLATGTLTVRQALEQTKEGIRFKQPKTHRSARPIALPAFVIDELRRHKGRQADLRLLMGAAWQDYRLVACQENGEPWKTKVISKAFEHLATRAGCPEIRFHDLRHTHASFLLGNQVPLNVVQQRLGHARALTTLDIYGHVLPGAQEEAARKVDLAFQAVAGER
jgi:integrase